MRLTKADLMGRAQSGQAPRTPLKVTLPTGGELGWLTALRQSAGDKRFTVFACRCGGQVIRESRKVVAAREAGGIPACDKCRAEAMVAAKERRAG